MNHHMKRQRGRGGQRKPGGHQPNRSFDSNGPDVKVRGPASHIYEKYMQLARDASSAGDRIQAENYLQHAEHYFRVLRAMQPVAPPPQLTDRYGEDMDFDGEEEGERAEAGAEGEAPREHQQRNEYQQRDRRDYQQRDRGDYQQREPRGDYQHRDRGEYQQQREQRGDYQPREPRNEQYREREPREHREYREPRNEGGEHAEANGERTEGAEGGDPRRGRRGRRNRFRTEGDRPPREEGGRQENGPVEGFGDSVPAFVGNE